MQQLVTERPDTIRHVADIARIEDVDQRASLVAAVRDQGLSRAQTRERVESLLHPTSPLPDAERHKSYSQEYDSDNNHKEELFSRMCENIGPQEAQCLRLDLLPL